MIPNWSYIIWVQVISLIIQDPFYTIQNLQRSPSPQTSNWSGTFFAVFLQQTSSSCDSNLIMTVGRKAVIFFSFLRACAEKKGTFILEKPLLCKQILFLSCRHFVCVQGQNKSCFFYNWNLFLREVLFDFDAWRLLFDNLLHNDKAIDFSEIFWFVFFNLSTY